MDFCDACETCSLCRKTEACVFALKDEWIDVTSLSSEFRTEYNAARDEYRRAPRKED